MWWRLHFRTVKIYTHLQELIADLRAAGLSQRANEVEETLKASSFAAELEDILIRINTTPASQIDSLLPQNWDLQPTLKYPGKATQTRL